MTSVTTEYALQRCKNIGFIRSINEIKSYCKNQLSNVLYITDTDNNEIEQKLDYIEKLQVSDDLDSIGRLDPTEHVSIYVELAHSKDTVTHEPISVDEIAKEILIKCNEYVETLDDEVLKAKVIKRFEKYVTDNRYFDDRELKPYVIDALVYLYEHVVDTDFQEHVVYLLKYNNYEKFDQLMQEHPVTYKVKPIKIYPHTAMFEDIKIATDKHIAGMNNRKYSRKSTDLTNEKRARSLLQLQQFTSNVFVVMNGKKNCAIRDCSDYQNHDVLKSLYVNGVHTVPMHTYDRPELSIERMVKHLHKLNSFDIVFIHPNLGIPGVVGDCPSEAIRPSYDICFGEILSIVYRYIGIHFFPYCSVYDESMEQLGFII